jgi:glycosyltransferase involved in cell wall biosynthesis
MAAGVPVVCPDLQALREVAGGLAAMVPPRGPAALAAVDSATHDPVCAAARQAHAARYTWQACAQATVRAYRKARA